MSISGMTPHLRSTPEGHRGVHIRAPEPRKSDDVEIARWGSKDVCLDTSVSMAATWSHPCTPAVRNLKELSRTNVDNRSSERCETEDGSRCPDHGRRLVASRRLPDRPSILWTVLVPTITFSGSALQSQCVLTPQQKRMMHAMDPWLQSQGTPESQHNMKEHDLH